MPTRNVQEACQETCDLPARDMRAAHKGQNPRLARRITRKRHRGAMHLRNRSRPPKWFCREQATWDSQRMPQPDLHEHARKGHAESRPTGTNPGLVRQKPQKDQKLPRVLSFQHRNRPPKWTYRACHSAGLRARACHRSGLTESMHIGLTAKGHNGPTCPKGTYRKHAVSDLQRQATMGKEKLIRAV